MNGRSTRPARMSTARTTSQRSAWSATRRALGLFQSGGAVAIPGCHSDAECRAGLEYCEVATRVCRQLHGFCASCQSDIECGAKSKCLKPAGGPVDQGGFCGRTCATDGDCVGLEATSCKDTVG